MTKSDVSIWFFVSSKAWFGWLTLLFLSEDTKTILKESIRVKAKSRKLYITRHVINHRKTKMALTLLSQFFFRLQSKWLWSAVSQWSLQKKYLLPPQQLRVGLLVIACWDQVKYEADSELWLLDFCWFVFQTLLQITKQWITSNSYFFSKWWMIFDIFQSEISKISNKK